MLPIFTAYANGEEIQFKGKDCDAWSNAGNHPSFHSNLEWRIKPKPREFSIATSTAKNNHHGPGVIQVSEGRLPKTSDVWDIIHVREIIDEP